MSITNGILRLDNGIQLRGGTAEVLSGKDVVPSEREIIIETDTGKFKIGDGVTSWGKLEYANGNAQDIGDISTLKTDNKDKLVKAVNEIVDNIGALTGLTTSDKTSLVTAINSIITERGALSSLTTSTKTSIVTAINTLVTRIATLEGYKHTLYDYIDSISTSSNGAGLHNSTYRGNSLGSSLTSTQRSNISSGTFKGLYIGDYWTINSKVYRIGDFDTYYRCKVGNTTTNFTTHHVVVVPDASMYTAQMNTSDTCASGYWGSAMRSSNLSSALSTVQSAFGSSYILSFPEAFSSSFSDGQVTNKVYQSVSIALMNEQMVYGSRIMGAAAGRNIENATLTKGKTQFNLFRFRPDLINIYENYWLRDIMRDGFFCHVNAFGTASALVASSTISVRPYFLVKG